MTFVSFRTISLFELPSRTRVLLLQRLYANLVPRRIVLGIPTIELIIGNFDQGMDDRTIRKTQNLLSNMIPSEMGKNPDPDPVVEGARENTGEKEHQMTRIARPAK